MKILVAPNSFKDSISAAAACRAIANGIRGARLTNIELVEVPLADGGEGTVEALVTATSGNLHKVQVTGPLGQAVQAVYGSLGPSAGRPDTVVIETAAAAGLTMIPPNERNPLKTTTFGLGQIIADSLKNGYRNFIIGLGGSATNDCGLGMVQALGVRFYDKQGNVITEPITGGSMAAIDRIDCGEIPTALLDSDFIAACDVRNPLLGPEGATYIYGPQKGATEESLILLESNIERVIGLIEQSTGKCVRNVPGAGAAGGLGAALMAFLNARLARGAQIVMEYCNLAEQITGTDLIITGEGRLDRSTAFGKAVASVASVAKERGIPLLVIAGQIAPDMDRATLSNMGITAVLGICDAPMSIQESLAGVSELLAAAAERAIRLIQIGIDCKLRRDTDQ